jgi:hypothetical protein
MDVSLGEDPSLCSKKKEKKKKKESDSKTREIELQDLLAHFTIEPGTVLR